MAHQTISQASGTPAPPEELPHWLHKIRVEVNKPFTVKGKVVDVVSPSDSFDTSVITLYVHVDHRESQSQCILLDTNAYIEHLKKNSPKEVFRFFKKGVAITEAGFGFIVPDQMYYVVRTP